MILTHNRAAGRKRARQMAASPTARRLRRLKVRPNRVFLSAAVLRRLAALNLPRDTAAYRRALAVLLGGPGHAT